MISVLDCSTEYLCLCRIKDVPLDDLRKTTQLSCESILSYHCSPFVIVRRPLLCSYAIALKSHLIDPLLARDARLCLK